jgi:hypothetical protein
MSSLHIIRSKFSLVLNIIILALAQDPFAGYNKQEQALLEWGKCGMVLIKDFEPIFQCNKSPLDGHPQARVSKVEKLVCIFDTSKTYPLSRTLLLLFLL